MTEFPSFMKSPANKIDTPAADANELEGYFYTGADGSQTVFWTCLQERKSSAHAHHYSEYIFVVDGCFTVIIDNVRFPLFVGSEFLIEKGVKHAVECIAGTRTIHVFGGKRIKNDAEG